MEQVPIDSKICQIHGGKFSSDKVPPLARGVLQPKIAGRAGERGLAMLSSDTLTGLQSSVSSKTQDEFALSLSDVPDMNKNFSTFG